MKRRESSKSASTAGAAAPASGASATRLSAETAGIRPTGQPWPLRSSEAFDFDSTHVGDRFAVGVWQPDEQIVAMHGVDLDKPLGLVYVLDGSFALAMAAGVCLLQLGDLVKPGFPPLILVGVDYPVGAPNSRSRDYTMEDSVPAAIGESLKALPKSMPGGAPKFLKFMEEELDPHIRANYNVNDRPAGLLGDSFGATFTYFAFIQQSKLFDRYWMGSPGIFTTGTDYVAKFEKTVDGDLVHDTRMFLSIGSLEMNGGVDFYEDMGRNFNATVSALSRHSNDKLTWESRIYPGHTHTTVFTPALNDALLHLYGPHQP